MLAEEIESYTGTLQLHVYPSGATAIFYLTEEITGFPALRENIPVGEYPLRVTMEGYETQVETVAIQKGKTTTIDIELKKIEGPKREPPKGKGFLTIYTSPPGMNVEIDNEIMDVTTPVEDIPLTEGEHKIIIGDFENFFFSDKETYVTISAGETTELPLELERKMGVLSILSEHEDAAIFINGKRVKTIKGEQTLVRNIPVGNIEVSIAKEGYYTWKKEVLLRPGIRTDVEVTLKPMPVKLVFDSTPQGAEVIFDGQRIGKTPIFI